MLVGTPLRQARNGHALTGGRGSWCPVGTAKDRPKRQQRPEPPYKTYILKKIFPLPYKQAILLRLLPLREGVRGWEKLSLRCILKGGQAPLCIPPQGEGSPCNPSTRRGSAPLAPPKDTLDPALLKKGKLPLRRPIRRVRWGWGALGRAPQARLRRGCSPAGRGGIAERWRRGPPAAGKWLVLRGGGG